MLTLNTKRQQDKETAAALGLSYRAFVARRALLQQQAEQQRLGRRRVFRLVLPWAGEVLTRMRFSRAKSRMLDKIIHGAGK